MKHAQLRLTGQKTTTTTKKPKTKPNKNNSKNKKTCILVYLNYKTLKTAGVQTSMLKHPTTQ